MIRDTTAAPKHLERPAIDYKCVAKVVIVTLLWLTVLSSMLLLSGQFRPIGAISTLSHAIGLPPIITTFIISNFALLLFTALWLIPWKSLQRDQQKSPRPAIANKEKEEKVQRPRPRIRLNADKSSSSTHSVTQSVQSEIKEAVEGKVVKISVHERGIEHELEFKEGKSLKACYDAFCDKYGFERCSLLVGGINFFAPERINGTEGEQDAYQWAEINIGSSKAISHYHLLSVPRDSKQKRKAPEQELKMVRTQFIQFRPQIGPRCISFVELPKGAKFKDCCDELAERMGVKPALTILDIWGKDGVRLTSTQNLGRNLFDIEKEHKFENSPALQFISITLTPEECREVCQLFKKYNFPRFPVNPPNDEEALREIRLSLWIECDRLLRRRPDAGSDTMNQQRTCFNKMDQDPDASDHAKGFIRRLAEMFNEGYRLYSASVTHSYDELLATMKEEFHSDVLPGDTNPGDDVIELKIRGYECRIDKRRLNALSSSFAQLIEEKNTELVEAQSIHLIKYLNGTLAVEQLSDSEMGALLDTAESFHFDNLSLLCQTKLIDRLRTMKSLSSLEVQLFQKTPFLKQAYGLWLGERLWESEQCREQIEEIKQNLGAVPEIAPVTVDKDYAITVNMPRGSKQVMKSVLMKSDYFRGKLSGYFGKEKDLKEITEDQDIPDEILVYMAGTKDYKTFTWEEINLLFPYADFLGLPELAHYFKSSACDALLKARKEDLKGEFCNIFRHLHEELTEWGIIFKTSSLFGDISNQFRKIF
jgi:hypothetical protein